MSGATKLQGNRSMRVPGNLVAVGVVAVVQAADDAITLLLALPGTHRAPAAYLPGQFITLAFPTTESILYRSYSLCGEGRADVPWEITVKRQHAGVVSNYLYSHIHPGMRLQASLPQGRFTLPETIRPDMPIVFVAGGSGITPIYGMLRALARLAPSLRPRVWLHYAFHSPADAIYAQELSKLDPDSHWLTQRYYITANGQRFRAEQALAMLGNQASHAHWYVCGPGGLKRSVETVALGRGVPATAIHAEVFASPPVLSTAAARSSTSQGRVRLADSGSVLNAKPGETVIETLERAGYRPDFECRAGACGTCRMRLLSGQVRNGVTDALTPAERRAGYILPCVAQPLGDITLASIGPPLTRSGHSTNNGARSAAAHRQSARKRLRLGMAVATLGLFFSLWNFTSHSAKSSTGSTAPSLPNLFPSGEDDGGSSGQGQSPSNPGSFSTQPSQNVPSTSTGVS
ncbi:MAG: 2Fe-2S iron-sulfur cluster-binding protein [Ktedonobacterales bacterium]